MNAFDFIVVGAGSAGCVAASREGALAAAGVRGTFANLIDERALVLATPWMFLTPRPGVARQGARH